jgi:hypothetical protein
MLRIRVCIALTFAGLLIPASALARVTASRTQRAQILAAAVHQGEVSSTQSACLNVTVSTVNNTYAALTWPAKLSKACAAVAANGVIVEHGKGSSWQVAAAGSTFACPISTVPIAVARDLGICP